MEFTLNRRFQEKDLPSMAAMRDHAAKLRGTLSLGETCFMREHGVRSESEYKRNCMKLGRIMKHTHIGWNSWDATARGFEKIYTTLKSTGSYVDRFGVCLDAVMGIPKELRHKLAVGTGIVFETPEEWAAVGQVVPVQPHLGDHMIGSLNSIENTCLALSAGVTTIGNVSHYYSYEYAGLEMEQQRTGDMVTALMLMGLVCKDGTETIVHSNLDDGYGSQFHDLANLVGWAMLERYLVEDLIGARMGHCFGNLFSDPILRITFNCAMAKINKYGTPGSMIYGNTIDFGFDFARNNGAMSSFILGDALGQIQYPTGHAICPIPVTEAARIPSVDEIIEAHRVVDVMIEKSHFYAPFIDWEKVQAETEILTTCGRIFFERVLNAFDDMKIDTQHAAEMFAMLKCIHPRQLEEGLGVGQYEKSAIRKRIPVRPTNIIKTINTITKSLIDRMGDVGTAKALSGLKVITCATDVHEFGKEICKSICIEAGADVFDLGSQVPTEEIIDAIRETESSVLLISTFNGIALSYASELIDLLRKYDLHVQIIMGGLINETRGGSDLPVDVTAEVTQLGITCIKQADSLVNDILAMTRH